MTIKGESIGGVLKISVGDTGIGIAAEDLASVVQPFNRGKAAFTIQPMDRIAQLVVVPVVQVKLNVVQEFAASERGAGGFGSTGES